MRPHRPDPSAGRTPDRVTVTLGPEALEEIVEVVASRVEERLRLADGQRGESPYLSVQEAAAFMRCSRSRIYDLLSSRRLRRFKDGTRVLVSRAELVAYLEGTLVPFADRRGRPSA